MEVDPRGDREIGQVEMRNSNRRGEAEWHDMCVDRAHAGVTKWGGTIPPVKMDQPGDSGSKRGGKSTEWRESKRKQTNEEIDDCCRCRSDDLRGPGCWLWLAAFLIAIIAYNIIAIMPYILNKINI